MEIVKLWENNISFCIGAGSSAKKFNYLSWKCNQMVRHQVKYNATLNIEACHPKKKPW